MNEVMKNIVDRRKEQLQSQKKFVIENIESLKESLAKSETDLEKCNYELSMLEENVSDKEVKREALVRGDMGVVRFECTDEQFRSIQLQLNTDDEYIYLPGNINIMRSDVRILKYA